MNKITTAFVSLIFLLFSSSNVIANEMIGIVDDIYSHIDDFISSYEVRLKTKLNDLKCYVPLKFWFAPVSP